MTRPPQNDVEVDEAEIHEALVELKDGQYFDILCAIVDLQNGDDSLLHCLARVGRPLPEKFLPAIGAAYYAILARDPRGRKPLTFSKNAGFCQLVEKWYCHELESIKAAGLSLQDLKDKTARERAADAVTKIFPLLHLSRSSVHRAVTLARKKSQ